MCYLGFYRQFRFRRGKAKWKFICSSTKRECLKRPGPSTPCLNMLANLFELSYTAMDRSTRVASICLAACFRAPWLFLEKRQIDL